MCESEVVLQKDGSEIQIMKDVARIVIDEGKIVIYDVLGNSKELDAKVKEINFIDHKTILE